MCLKVLASGLGTVYASGTRLTVTVTLMRGEHDDRLKWPFQGAITIQLLNQKGDRGHVQFISNFDNEAAVSGTASRVTSGERNIKGWGADLISHTTLESPTETIQYLHNDSLKWRVTNAKV